MRTEIKTLEVYIADDGKEFISSIECEKYEKCEKCEESKITKKRMEQKKLADKMIIKDVYCVPQCSYTNNNMYHTYFRVSSQNDWELLDEVYNLANHPYHDIHSFYLSHFPEILICESWIDIKDKAFYQDVEQFERFERSLNECHWSSVSEIREITIDYWKKLGYKAVFEKYDSPKHDQRKKVEKNFYNGQHVWLVSDNTYLSELYLRSCDRPAYEILEGIIREKNQKNVKVEVASERIDNLLNFMLDGERDTEFGIKEANYGNRVLCTSREDAEKHIEKTKLMLEIHSRGIREKDFSLSQLHELQNYLEKGENDNAEK